MTFQIQIIAFGLVALVTAGVIIYNYMTEGQEQPYRSNGSNARPGPSYRVPAPPSPANRSISNRPRDGSTRQRRNGICSLCREGDANTILICGHAFHQNCMTPWLNIESICPTCRAPC